MGGTTICFSIDLLGWLATREFHWLEDLLPTIDCIGKLDSQEMLSVFRADCIKYGMNVRVKDAALNSQAQKEDDIGLGLLEQNVIMENEVESEEELECMCISL